MAIWTGTEKQEPGWVPYIWLGYLVFFFFHPVLDHVGAKEWAATIAGVAIFVTFYGLFFRLRTPWNRLPLLCMILLGLVYSPWNEGGVGFFIYASSFLPFVLETESAALAGLAGILAMVVLEWRFAHLSRSFLFVGIFFSILSGASSIYFAQRNRNLDKLRLAHSEIEHLAKVAERERIARDLHDVLGHTLSLIALKSELAGKLLDRDPEQARREIHDVETAARDALAEVRQAILGYRAKGLPEEFKQAKSTLETAGIHVELQSNPVQLPAAHESVLSLALREAVTNVVRHARAHNCSLRFERINGHCKLEIRDDGRGGFQLEGNGLRGMRERIESLGGKIERQTERGTRIAITLPMPSAGESGPA
jgi:two-component system, NarL family, sensor histidine kinase DesK